jgi:hypothetical protein
VIASEDDREEFARIVVVQAMDFIVDAREREIRCGRPDGESGMFILGAHEGGRDQERQGKPSKSDSGTHGDS